MLATILVQVPLVIAPLLQAPAPPPCQLEVLTPITMEERSLATFNANVDAYVTLQRRLARALPPSEMFDEEDSLVADELKRVLVAARPFASPGEFFSPGVALVLRQRLDEALPWLPLNIVLPAVPRPLVYEFWGRDLALVDASADLVLDVLPDALPPDAVSDVIYR
jgi:hypothetical protein